MLKNNSEKPSDLSIFDRLGLALQILKIQNQKSQTRETLGDQKIK